ncbi:MAG: PEGA domain-containing protein [Myxococcales bacterium]|nr:PEGA domain-containing protein [Myxococcales bacterium]
MRRRWIAAALVAGAITPILILTVLGMRPDPPQLPETEEWRNPAEPPTILLGSGPVPNVAAQAPEVTDAAPAPQETEEGEGEAPVDDEAEAVVAAPPRKVALHPALTPMPVAPPPMDEEELPRALGEDRVVLRIHTLPPGTTVELDGRSRGRSPVKLMVNPGSHTLLLDAGGGLQGQFRVQATEDLRLCYSTSDETLQPVDCGDLLGR